MSAKQTKDTLMSIETAAKYSGIKAGRLRTLLRKGKIKGERVQLEGTGYRPWKVGQAALDAYKASSPSGGRSGVRKYIIRLDAAQVEEIAALLKQKGIDLERPRRKAKKVKEVQQTETGAEGEDEDEDEEEDDEE